ncbi:hypothetical protein PUNSTDRAFT_113562 [Punctularia strigosozonata HHB-11173 SS5]|uniref:uncharacterized protein n=1 Tax=Punctularia strigosozonata (strain HHB-11173) TaxID=741275 RepID=UPI0004417FF0|nr:uncharacterized protein PUNSTDRAFT_113562 [Punctularia strigosozonata HHB-11173 SS5]EIN09011.1 hypothetical protein PUNSTDRAFT_113562 [Punctularia strigosozonata HHB-11173 SS5]
MTYQAYPPPTDFSDLAQVSPVCNDVDMDELEVEALLDAFVDEHLSAAQQLILADTESESEESPYAACEVSDVHPSLPSVFQARFGAGSTSFVSSGAVSARSRKAHASDPEGRRCVSKECKGTDKDDGSATVVPVRRRKAARQIPARWRNAILLPQTSSRPAKVRRLVTAPPYPPPSYPLPPLPVAPPPEAAPSSIPPPKRDSSVVFLSPMKPVSVARKNRVIPRPIRAFLAIDPSKTVRKLAMRAIPSRREATALYRKKPRPDSILIYRSNLGQKKL